MSNNITIKLSDKAIVQIVKILSESTTPTGMPINPMQLLGALGGGMPRPRPNPEESKEEKRSQYWHTNTDKPTNTPSTVELCRFEQFTRHAL